MFYNVRYGVTVGQCDKHWSLHAPHSDNPSRCLFRANFRYSEIQKKQNAIFDYGQLRELFLPV